MIDPFHLAELIFTIIHEIVNEIILIWNFCQIQGKKLTSKQV